MGFGFKANNGRRRRVPLEIWRGVEPPVRVGPPDRCRICHKPFFTRVAQPGEALVLMSMYDVALCHRCAIIESLEFCGDSRFTKPARRGAWWDFAFAVGVVVLACLVAFWAGRRSVAPPPAPAAAFEQPVIVEWL